MSMKEDMLFQSFVSHSTLEIPLLDWQNRFITYSSTRKLILHLEVRKRNDAEQVQSNKIF